jgi:predicted secreted protein
MDRQIIKTILLVTFLFPLLTFGTEIDTTRISLKKNEKYQISLDYCPGAGFCWTISDTTDKTIIALIERKSKVKEGNGPKGGTYTDLFVFQAMEAGDKIITLDYKYLSQTKKLKF